MNVLAPCWTAPKYYPPSCWSSYNATRRLSLKIAFLTQNITGADAYALAETQLDENAAIAAALQKKGYKYFSAYHNDAYWSKWITDDPPFKRNGVSIAVKTKTFDTCQFHDVPLSDDGNHAAIAVCRHKAFNQTVRIASVHFDSDTGGRRGKETEGLRNWLGPSSSAIDIVAGDFNQDTDTGVVQQSIMSQGFFNVLRSANASDQTHPWGANYYKNSMYGIIDHVIARGSGIRAVEGHVYNMGLWQRYPLLGGTGQPNEDNRICACVEENGSDHFAIHGVLLV